MCGISTIRYAHFWGGGAGEGLEILNCVSTIEDIEKECGDITGINLDELFAEEFEETTVKVLKRAMETRTSKLKGTHPCP